jgi:hypothetical protein
MMPSTTKMIHNMAIGVPLHPSLETESFGCMEWSTVVTKHPFRYVDLGGSRGSG